jgi:hypothetical protein
MRTNFFVRRALFIAASGIASMSFVACSHPRYYDDTVNNDRHRWDSREERAYRRWEAEQRMEHVAYERRAADQQRAYWNWRHSHPNE